MATFAVYLHPHIGLTSKPLEFITFIGHSVPYFTQVRQALEKTLSSYPQLSLRLADDSEYLRVHTATYLEKLKQLAADEVVENPPRLSAECTGFEYCLPGYGYGLGGMLEAIDQMQHGNLERAYCFSLGGHHAYPDWGHGYCVLNPQAAATRYAQALDFKRVLIVDWDIHHGDGTQAIFANDPTVYCLSIHSAADLYMSAVGALRAGTTTAAEAIGHCNLPVLSEIFDDDFWRQMELPGRYYRSAESLSAFQTALEQIPWMPDLIMVFSGYDSHREDCGGGITDWTNDDFRRLTQSVLALARTANCPVLSVHGGGYTLPVAVSAAQAHIETLAHFA